MKGVDTYGANTVPSGGSNDTFYDNDAVENYTLAAATATLLAASTAGTVSATWYMPIEADTYTDVPRLSPNDSLLGWKSYAPNTVTAGSIGKMMLQETIAMSVITDAFATTVAAGFALVGATALSF